MRLTIVLLTMVLARSAAADLVVRQRSATGRAGATPREETVYVAGPKVVSDGAATRTIVDLDAQTITVADKSAHTYTVITFEQVGAQMEALRKAMDRMPPEQRRQMAPLLDDDVQITVTATGRTATIAGHRAAEHTIAGGPYTGSVWTSEEIPVPPEFRRWETLAQSNGAAHGAGRRLGEAIAKLPGFPVRSRIETRTGSEPFVIATEVQEVREARAPAAMLTVPDGFTKKASGPDAAEPHQ